MPRPASDRVQAEASVLSMIVNLLLCYAYGVYTQIYNGDDDSRRVKVTSSEPNLR